MGYLLRILRPGSCYQNLEISTHAFEVLAAHADVRLVYELPALFTVNGNKGANALPTQVDSFRLDGSGEEQCALEHEPGRRQVVKSVGPGSSSRFQEPSGALYWCDM